METFDEVSLPIDLIRFMAFNKVIFWQSDQSPYYIQKNKITKIKVGKWGHWWRNFELNVIKLVCCLRFENVTHAITVLLNSDDWAKLDFNRQA